MTVPSVITDGAPSRPTVASALRSIADDIERLGHYRRGGDRVLDPLHGPCCVIANPTMFNTSLAFQHEVWREMRHLANAAGEVKETHWSDNTPTTVVLAALRTRADELDGAK